MRWITICLRCIAWHWRHADGHGDGDVGMITEQSIAGHVQWRDDVLTSAASSLVR